MVKISARPFLKERPQPKRAGYRSLPNYRDSHRSIIGQRGILTHSISNNNQPLLDNFDKDGDRMGEDGDVKYAWGGGRAIQSKKYSNSTINCVAMMDNDEGGDLKEDT